jgi:hypothetical protein
MLLVLEQAVDQSKTLKLGSLELHHSHRHSQRLSSLRDIVKVSSFP